MYIRLCCGSGFGWIRIDYGRLDPDPSGQGITHKKERDWGNVLRFKCDGDILQFFVIKTRIDQKCWIRIRGSTVRTEKKKHFSVHLWPSFSLSRWILRNGTGHGYILFDLGIRYEAWTAGGSYSHLVCPLSRLIHLLSRKPSLVAHLYLFSVYIILCLHYISSFKMDFLPNWVSYRYVGQCCGTGTGTVGTVTFFLPCGTGTGTVTR